MARKGDKRYGAGSDEAFGFHILVYHAAQQIPYGKVTTYGHLAYLAGRPDNSRQAGSAMKFLTVGDSIYNTRTVPWWRVINASGHVSPRPGRDAHIERLREEIPVTDKGGVSLAQHGWFPEPEDIDLEVDFDQFYNNQS